MPSEAIPNLTTAGTFMGIPRAERASEGQAVILGLPFDCGTHPTRIGSRQGPEAFRQHSSLVRPFYPALADVDIRDELNMVDLGDAAVVASDIEDSFPKMEAAVAAIAAAGGLPLCVGGDGTISLPVLRGLHQVYGDLVFVHVDAHTDSYDMPGINPGTTFTRAADERLIETRRSFHVGARGTLATGGAYDQTRALGYRLIDGDAISARGPDSVAAEIRDVVGGRPVHLSFDLDYFDPSAAPGVATPTWGGPPAAEVFRLLHGLRGLRFVSADINTLSPPHDVGGMTATLAGHVAVIALHLIRLGRNSQPVRGRPPQSGGEPA